MITTSNDTTVKFPDFLGLSSREIENYDLMGQLNRKFMRGSLHSARHASFEDECTQEIHRRLGLDKVQPAPHGLSVRVPRDVLMQRTMSAQPGPKGGYTVGTQLSFVEGFYAANLALELGMRKFDAVDVSGVGVPNLAMATVNQGATCGWLAPSGSITASDPQFGLKSATPKTAVAIELASDQLLRQLGAEGQAFLLADLAMNLGAAVGKAAISGAGGSEPLGVLNMPGVGSESGTSITWTAITNMIADVHSTDAVKNRAAAGWAVAPDVEALLRRRERAAGNGWIMDGDEIAGRRALAGNAVPAGKLVYGAWDQLVLVNWGGLEIMVNENYNFDTATAAIRAMWHCDIVARKVSAFSVATSIT